MSVEVVVTDEFKDWYYELDETDNEAVYYYVSLLEQLGLALKHPYSSAINGSQYAMRELRVQSKGRPLRVLYAFDPKRQAVLIIGGEKTGDDRFYEWIIPRADEIFRKYLEEDDD